METHSYNVDINWKADRKGILSSPEIDASGTGLEVATPPPFPKGITGIWSPEHLFTAAVSSCLMTTFLAIAENSNLKFESFSCHAAGKLEKIDGKLAVSEVHLHPIVIIEDEKDRDRTERILQKSEAGCLISNSVKSTITMVSTILVK